MNEKGYKFLASINILQMFYTQSNLTKTIIKEMKLGLISLLWLHAPPYVTWGDAAEAVVPIESL